MPTTTMLYHPLMSPPEGWVKDVILHCDDVSTFVPEGGGRSETVRMLLDYGQFREMYLQNLDGTDRLVPEAVSAAQQVHARVSDPRQYDQFFVHAKLPQSLIDALRAAEVVAPTDTQSEHGPLVAARSEVLRAVFSVCADYASAVSPAFMGTQFVPSTDDDLAARQAREPLTDGEALNVQAVVVGGLPAGNREQPLEKLLAFKRKRADELAAMRAHLEALTATEMGRARHGGEIDLALRGLEKAVDEVFRSAEDPSLLIRSRSNLVAIAGVGLAAQQIATTPMAELLSGAAGGAVAALGAYDAVTQIRKRRQELGPMRVLVDAARKGLITRPS